ncbi:MAG: hypothetical protein Q9215_004722 [Flavoplaca cf. flavocitrina]
MAARKRSDKNSQSCQCDADEATEAFKGQDGEVLVLDEATSIALLKRIDLHVMPTKKERGTRVGIWFSFNRFAQIFGGLIAYAMPRASVCTVRPKIVLLVAGLLTVLVGALFLIFMHDNQINARWLSLFDCKLAIERLKEVLGNPLTWAFAFYVLATDLPDGGITNFLHHLIVSFGFTPEQSLLHGTPGGAVEIVALIACGSPGDRYGSRLFISTSGLILAILGKVLIVALPLSNAGARLAGYDLTQASPIPFVTLLALIATNLAGWTK